jgi:hypothetical protein
VFRFFCQVFRGFSGFAVLFRIFGILVDPCLQTIVKNPRNLKNLKNPEKPDKKTETPEKT